MLRRVAPAAACSLRELGQAMLRVSEHGYAQPVLRVKAMQQLAALIWLAWQG